MTKKMKKKLYNILMYFCLICLCLAGCKTTGENTATIAGYANATSTATKTAKAAVSMYTATLTPTEMLPSVTLQPKVSLTPTYTQLVLPAVTMSPQESEMALLELLRTNGNCRGKCIAGIWPDDMNVQDAVDIMSQWGMVRVGKNSLGQTFINLNQDPLYEQVRIILSVGTWTKELETIDNVAIYIGGEPGEELLGEDLWLANRDAWVGFSLNNILMTYGIPSYVGFFFQTTVEIGSPLEGRTISYGLEMQFERLNLVVSLGAMAYYNGANLILCPTQDPRDMGIEINPERSINGRQEFYPVTWQALTATDMETFYSLFTDKANLDACVTTNLEQIRELQPYFR